MTDEEGSKTDVIGAVADTVDSSSPKPNIGVHYDTDWTRTKGATTVRNVAYATIIGPLSRFICSPNVYGLEHLESEKEPLIFAPNHVSHFDTLALLCVLPAKYRKHIVVAAAVDNFFNKRWKCVFYSLFLGTIPVERTRVNRKSADVAARLIGDNYNLLIFPEGGRSFTDQMMEFRGGAAYLAKRCATPVIPIYLEGVRKILPKGSSRIHRASINVFIGPALRPYEATETTKAEDARRFTVRIQQAVVALGATPPDQVG